MIDIHLKKLRARDEIKPEEERVIRNLVGEVVEVPQDRTFVPHGTELRHSVLLLSGWMARAKDLPDGRRQVAELHVAGDFVDLHGFTLKRLDHDVITITRCKVALVPHERLTRLTEQYPHLARLYWFSTNVDAAIHREMAVSLGQRSAIARMSHLFCELYERLAAVGRTDGAGYEFPLTQRELSECLGLTVVHANRTLQELRRRNLVELENRQLTIRDRRGLEGVAEFDPTYLYLERREI